MTGKEYIDSLAGLFEKNRDKKTAQWSKAYLKDQYEFYGLKSPLRNQLFKEHRERHDLPKEWREAVSESWKHDEREMQYIGMEIAFRSKKHWVRSDLALFESLVTEKSWWDTVDYIASNIMGHYLYTFSDLIPEVTHRWNTSDNMWLNRTSILFQLKYKDYTDFKLLQKMINRHKYSKEFFLQKAIGWSLRQYAKFDPDAVQAFVTETELKPLSRREALKNIKQ